MKTTWLVLGSSPNAPSGLDTAVHNYEIGATITTNRGIYLLEQPTVYLLADQVGIKLFLGHAQAAQKQGTKLVALRQLYVPHDWSDEVIENDSHGWGKFGTAGVACIEYAAKQADRVLVVGCEGYREKVSPYFASPQNNTPCLLGYGHGHRIGPLTERLIRPLTQAIVDKYPDVEFVCYGRTHYQIEAANWRTVNL